MYLLSFLVDNFAGQLSDSNCASPSKHWTSSFFLSLVSEGTRSDSSAGRLLWLAVNVIFFKKKLAVDRVTIFLITKDYLL